MKNIKNNIEQIYLVGNDNEDNEFKRDSGELKYNIRLRKVGFHPNKDVITVMSMQGGG